MTGFTICMTAIAAFLLGFNVGECKFKGKATKTTGKHLIKGGTLEFSNDEYRNFLSYDGSEQA